MTGSPSLLPRTQIAQNGDGKCRVSVATNIFRARCCTHSPRFATQGCSSPSCSMPGGSCPAGCPGLAAREGPQGLLGSFPPPRPQKEPKALVERWVAPHRGSSSAVPVPRISSVFQHEPSVEMGRWAPPAAAAPAQHPQVMLGAVVTLAVCGSSGSCPLEPHMGTPRGHQWLPNHPAAPAGCRTSRAHRGGQSQLIPIQPHVATKHCKNQHGVLVQHQSQALNTTRCHPCLGQLCPESLSEPGFSPKFKPFQAMELNKPPGMVRAAAFPGLAADPNQQQEI